MPKRDESVVNYGMSCENKLPPRPINSLAAPSTKKHFTTKGSKWSRGEFHEDKLLVHGPRNPSPRREDASRHSLENIGYGGQNYSQNCLKQLSTSNGFSGDLSSCYESDLDLQSN
ncbi:hypothetical protein POM88_011948 [Heracleum sosnowskyi]|uniref:Uncharacterized protein n=1 Tax=Heracleum sosnowskyi TaxID=360622 RepID=A0AAD8IYV8_9APIA|nr:hypothetical protein POM88_011948 [Heracleum sosnowskyi]